jgi:hypothetical protein
MTPTGEQRAPDRTSRWDLPASIQRQADAAQAAYCRTLAHRYTQAKYVTLVILVPVNLYLWYDVLIGQGMFGGTSFSRSLLVLVPWLAATVGLWVSFHHRAQHYLSLAIHIEKSRGDGPQA